MAVAAGGILQTDDGVVQTLKRNSTQLRGQSTLLSVGRRMRRRQVCAATPSRAWLISRPHDAKLPASPPGTPVSTFGHVERCQSAFVGVTLLVGLLESAASDIHGHAGRARRSRRSRRRGPASGILLPVDQAVLDPVLRGRPAPGHCRHPGERVRVELELESLAAPRSRC